MLLHPHHDWIVDSEHLVPVPRHLSAHLNYLSEIKHYSTHDFTDTGLLETRRRLVIKVFRRRVVG